MTTLQTLLPLRYTARGLTETDMEIILGFALGMISLWLYSIHSDLQEIAKELEIWRKKDSKVMYYPQVEGITPTVTYKERT